MLCSFFLWGLKGGLLLLRPMSRQLSRLHFCVIRIRASLVPLQTWLVPVRALLRAVPSCTAVGSHQLVTRRRRCTRAEIDAVASGITPVVSTELVTCRCRRSCTELATAASLPPSMPRLPGFVPTVPCLPCRQRRTRSQVDAAASSSASCCATSTITPSHSLSRTALSYDRQIAGSVSCHCVT